MGKTLERPQALTPDVQGLIVQMMAAGVALTTACQRAGVSRQAVDYWRRLYEAGAEHAQKYADFFTALKKAAAEAEVDALAILRRGEQGWQAQAWFLERRFPQRWSAKQKVAAVHSGSVSLTHEQALAELDGPDDADGTTEADSAP